MRARGAATGESDSAMTEEGLLRLLDPVGDQKLLNTRLDRLHRALVRAEGELALMREAFFVLVEVYFLHTPEVPLSRENDAKRTAALRFRRLFEEPLARRLTAASQAAMVSDPPPPPADEQFLAQREPREREQTEVIPHDNSDYEPDDTDT